MSVVEGRMCHNVIMLFSIRAQDDDDDDDEDDDD